MFSVALAKFTLAALTPRPVRRFLEKAAAENTANAINDHPKTPKLEMQSIQTSMETKFVYHKFWGFPGLGERYRQFWRPSVPNRTRNEAAQPQALS